VSSKRRYVAIATSSDVSVGLAHELTITAIKVGWEPKDFADLAHSEEKAAQVLAYLRGFSEIKPIKHAIDCDADPFLPVDWDVEEHRKGGILIWDPTKVSSFLSKSQKGDKYIVGTKLRKEMSKKPALNSNVLDYLLKNPHLIPEEYKGKRVFFWGTIYRDSFDSLYVRYLCWDDSAWRWSDYWLGDDFDSGDPAAVSAS